MIGTTNEIQERKKKKKCLPVTPALSRDEAKCMNLGIFDITNEGMCFRVSDEITYWKNCHG